MLPKIFMQAVDRQDQERIDWGWTDFHAPDAECYRIYWGLRGALYDFNATWITSPKERIRTRDASNELSKVERSIAQKIAITAFHDSFNLVEPRKPFLLIRPNVLRGFISGLAADLFQWGVIAVAGAPSPKCIACSALASEQPTSACWCRHYRPVNLN